MRSGNFFPTYLKSLTPICLFTVQLFWRYDKGKWSYLANSVWSFTMIFLGDHDIPLTGSNFGNLTAFRAIFSHIFTAHAQERPFMNFRLKF